MALSFGIMSIASPRSGVPPAVIIARMSASCSAENTSLGGLPAAFGVQTVRQSAPSGPLGNANRSGPSRALLFFLFLIRRGDDYAKPTANAKGGIGHPIPPFLFTLVARA